MKKAVAAVLVMCMAACTTSPMVNQMTPGQRIDAYVNVAIAFYKAEHLDEDTEKFEQKLRLIIGAVKPFVDSGSLEDKFALLIIELRGLIAEELIDSNEKTFWRIQAIVLMFEAFGYTLPIDMIAPLTEMGA